MSFLIPKKKVGWRANSESIFFADPASAANGRPVVKKRLVFKDDGKCNSKSRTDTKIKMNRLLF